MAEWILCCLRWRYSAVDRNANRQRLVDLPEVQLDTTHMGTWLIPIVTIVARHVHCCSADRSYFYCRVICSYSFISTTVDKTQLYSRANRIQWMFVRCTVHVGCVLLVICTVDSIEVAGMTGLWVLYMIAFSDRLLLG